MTKHIFIVGDGFDRDIYLPSDKLLKQRKEEARLNQVSKNYTTEELDYFTIFYGRLDIGIYYLGSLLMNSPNQFAYLNSLPGKTIFDKYDYFFNIKRHQLSNKLNKEILMISQIIKG